MDKQLLNDIAKAAFRKTPMTLTKREASFVAYQAKLYRIYQDKVREKALEVMGKGKLSTREYNIIREWFFKIIPLHVVLRSIDTCLENQRSTGRAIYSLGFFKATVTGEFRRHLRMMVGSNYFGDPWGYHEWQSRPEN